MNRTCCESNVLDTHLRMCRYSNPQQEFFFSKEESTDILKEPPPASATSEKSDMVNHPSHYGDADSPYEVIKVLEAWGLQRNAYLFNVVKYIARSEKKGKRIEDLKKARFYLDRFIERLEQGMEY